MAPADDPVLTRFRAALERAYGRDLERAVLYGSRARGEAGRESDYDVAVFLKGVGGFGRQAQTLADIETEILLETGAVINALPLKAGSHRARTGLMGEIRRDGRDL